MRHLFFLTLGIFAVLLAGAQDTTHLKDTIRSTKTTRKKTTEFYKENYKHVRRKFDSTLFTTITLPTTSDYAEDLEKTYQLLNKVPLVTESFVHLQEIDDQLDDEDSALNILKERMA